MGFRRNLTPVIKREMGLDHLECFRGDSLLRPCGNKELVLKKEVAEFVVNQLNMTQTEFLLRVMEVKSIIGVQPIRVTEATRAGT